MKRNFLFLLFVGFLSLGVSAASNQGTGVLKVTKIEIWSGNGIYIHTSKAVVNPSACSTTDKYFMPDTMSDLARSMLLTAYTANTNISFVIYGGGCSGNRPQIVSVSLEKN